MKNGIIKKSTIRFGTGMAITALISEAAMAQDPLFGGDLSFDASIGYEYNSVVTIEELDEITAGGDSLINLRLGADYKQEIAKNTEVAIGYTYAQKTHDTLSRFDRNNHYLTAQIEHDFGKTEIGVQYRIYDGSRDNDGFVLSNRIRPYVKTRLSKDLRLEAFYSYEDKEFDQSVSRDAKDNELGAQLTWRLDGSRRYIQLRYVRENSDSVGDEFDYDADKIRAAFTQKIRVAGDDLRARVSWSYDKRNYKNETPSIGAIREDDRHRLGIDLRYPITDNVDIQAEYQKAIYQSNLPTADYDRDRVRVGLAFSF